MKKIRIFSVVISVVLFFAVVAFGANRVFSVEEIEIKYTVVSAEGRSDSEALQKKLEKEYVGKSSFFVKKEEVLSAFRNYPYFIVTDFKKVYPNKLTLSVEEKTEKYAFAVTEGDRDVYYVADDTGDILRKSEKNENKADGGENVLVTGLKFSNGNFTADEYFSVVIRSCEKAEQFAGAARSCIESFEIQRDATGAMMIIETREGVTIYIDNPAVETDKKIEAAIRYYIELEDKDKLFGYITVLDDMRGDGAIVGPTYTPRE